MRAPRPDVAWSTGRQRRRVAYATYITSPRWFARREQWVREWQTRHPGKVLTCAVCPRPWSLDDGDLHHASYSRLGEEEFADLVAICRPHHDRLHDLFDASIAWRRLGRRAATAGIIARLRAERSHQEGQQR